MGNEEDALGLERRVSPEDLARLRIIKERAGNLWAKDAVRHPFFTLHGGRHARAVERIAGELLETIPSLKGKHPNVDSRQCFYLLASTWLHDTGMVLALSDEEHQAAVQEGLSISDWVRAHHHTRSGQYVLRHASDLCLNDSEAAIIAALCEAHRKVPLCGLSENYPNQRFLAALLRAADELDVTRSRAPKELMDEVWTDMDRVSRWHWIKHHCVVEGRAYHARVAEDSRVRVSYSYVMLLPSPTFVGPFWDRVMQPIRKVVDHEDVNLILQGMGLSIECDHFSFNPTFEDSVLPDRRKLSEWLNELLVIPPVLSEAASTALGRLKERNPITARMLQRQYFRLLNEAAYLQIETPLEEVITGYLEALGDAQNLESAERVHEEAKRRFDDETSLCCDLPSDIERELLKMIDLGWRLVSLDLGDPSTRERHLRHILPSLGADAVELARWVLGQAALSSTLKQAVVSLLGVTGAKEAYDVVLGATKAADPAVRRQAVRALGQLRGPRTFERLGEVVDVDVDGEVREEATAVLRALTNPMKTAAGALVGKRVLVIEVDQWVISPLVDSLSRRGAEVRVATEATALEQALLSWRPDVLLCELVGVDPEKPADSWSGLELARTSREALGDCVPIVATSVMAPEDIAGPLANIGRYAYVRKPTTIDAFVRAMESLLSSQSN